MQTWGWNLSWLLLHPQQVLGYGFCGFLCWWLCESSCMPKGPLGQLPKYPKWRQPLRAIPATVIFVSVHNRWQAMSESHILVDSFWGRIWSSSFPRESAPVPHNSHYTLEPDLGASAPTTEEQTQPLTGLWQPQSKEDPTHHPVQAVVSLTPNTSPIKGTRASTIWGHTWQTSIPKTALAPKILDSVYTGSLSH